MAIPKYDDLALPILQWSAETESITYAKIIEKMISKYNFTDEELEQKVPSGTRTVIAARAYWTVTYLSKAGLLYRKSKGKYIITAEGKNVLKNPPERIDRSFLMQFKSFEEFVTKRLNEQGALGTIGQKEKTVRINLNIQLPAETRRKLMDFCLYGKEQYVVIGWSEVYEDVNISSFDEYYEAVVECEKKKNKSKPPALDIFKETEEGRLFWTKDVDDKFWICRAKGKAVPLFNVDDSSFFQSVDVGSGVPVDAFMVEDKEIPSDILKAIKNCSGTARRIKDEDGTVNRFSKDLFNKKSDKEIYKIDTPANGQLDSLDFGDFSGICGINRIYYGVPGAGKSWKIKEEVSAWNVEEPVARVVFHPDYTYADFVGQILPKSDGKTVEYPFVPGPFTRILAKAINNPENNYALVIEEINRGNAAAIFGDLFQLLDRKGGESEYGITNENIAGEVYKEDINELRKKIEKLQEDAEEEKEQLEDEISAVLEKEIKLPKNLLLLATMNTSDQNVFPLDTAFQRRWDMRLIKNDFDIHATTEEGRELQKAISKAPLFDINITWENFCKVINKKIAALHETSLIASEDKRLGVFFITPELLQASTKDSGEVDGEALRSFGNKILKYLWDDAFKMKRNEVFNKETLVGNGEEKKDFSLETVISTFENSAGPNRLKNVFKSQLFEEMAALFIQPIAEIENNSDDNQDSPESIREEDEEDE